MRRWRRSRIIDLHRVFWLGIRTGICCVRRKKLNFAGLAVASIAAVTLLPSAFAQTSNCASAINEATSGANVYHGQPTLLAVTKSVDLTGQCEVLSVYRKPEADRLPTYLGGPPIDGFAVRRIARNAAIETTSQSGFSVQWADSRSCPSLRKSLYALRQISPPTIRILGMETTFGPVHVDGAAYTFIEPHRLSFTAQESEPLATWFTQFLISSRYCWTNQPSEQN